ncbi:Scr1 family TA system antitoxin-like transcriptional regulator [Streptomyces sp. NPDC051956]|uniref:Scr1 family TA system antitoxin-like transcriptional regulator n=1 Tax=Streptomyces sp. NPDC051956 TaxID=3365677 RepID=UPI0037CF7706
MRARNPPPRGHQGQPTRGPRRRPGQPEWPRPRRLSPSPLVLRRQLERLLELGRLRNVSIQVMPTAREDHAGLQGESQVLKFRDGTAVGRSEGAFNGRAVSEPKLLRVLELRYGMIRAQALAPRESLVFIEQLLGET